MCSEDNQGSLIAYPTQECLQLSQVPPPSRLRSIPQEAPRHGRGRRSPHNPQAQGQHCVLKGTTTATFPPLCLAPPQGNTPGPVAVAPSSLWGVPTSSATDQPGLSIWDCCRRCHGQRSLIRGAWPDSPGSHIPHISPKTALPCHGDAALGPSAGKVLAGCHSPVQKHRRLASECWSMSNLPRRAKSQDGDLQILL